MGVTGKIRRWGNSYGILLSKKEMKKKNLHENETVLVDIRKKIDVEKLFGICSFKKSVDEIMKEVKEGYEE